MATTYQLIYKRTNRSNINFSTNGAAATKSMGLSNYKISGSGVGVPIGKITSIKMTSYWTDTGTGDIQIRLILVTSAGNLYSSYDEHAPGGVTKYTHTITGATAAHINGLENIQFQCKSYSSSSDLYYRANFPIKSY